MPDHSAERWFLSYNSKDYDAAHGFYQALRSTYGAQLFFAQNSLQGGNFWLPELAKQIAESTAFVLFVGPNGVGPWQEIEYFEAFDKRSGSPKFPVILVLLEGRAAPGLPFLRQLHWIVTADPTSAQTLALVKDATQGRSNQQPQLWRHTAPYRGLAAMTEVDSDFFFGRTRETIEVIETLQTMRGRLPILLGNSGVGKSSLAQAGVIGCLKRQGWPMHATSNGKPATAWPAVFANSRRWYFLSVQPGTDPMHALVGAFLQTWQFEATDPRKAGRQNEWEKALLTGEATLSSLLDATEGRCEELGLPKPPHLFLYIDQGEELYVRAGEYQRQRFAQVLQHGLKDDRLSVLMSMRSDFFGHLQNDEYLFPIHHHINVPPLREDALLEVVSKPAAMLGARFESQETAAKLARRAAEESVKDTGALPLLSYLLDDMWTQMVDRDDGTLRLPPAAFELGGVLAERADAFVARNPQHEQTLRKLFAYKLASIRDDGEPTRRRAHRSEFSEDEWRIVTQLTDNPYRLLSTVAIEGSEPYVQVAHEAIFRSWERLRGWLTSEQEFLAWKSKLEAERLRWLRVPEPSRNDALLMGFALLQAREWAERRAADLSPADLDFIRRSNEREDAERTQTARLRRRVRYAVMAAPIAALIVIVAGVMSYLYHQASQANRDAEESRRAETAERTLAEINRRQVLDLLNNILENANSSASTDDTPSPTLIERGVSDSPPTPQGIGAKSPATTSGDPTDSSNRSLPTVAEAIEAVKILVEKNPDDAGLLRSLARSLKYLGDTKLRHRQFDAAASAFEQGIEIFRNVSWSKPNDTASRNDLSIMLAGAARVHVTSGAREQGRPYLEEAVTIQRELEPASQDRILESLQDHLGELGDLYIGLGERDEALKVFEERLNVRKRRLDLAVGNLQRMSEVSIALDRVGQLLRDRGNLDRSLTYFEDALRIDRSLVQQSSGNREWQERLVRTLNRVGEVQHQRGRYADALKLFEQALPIQRKLASGPAIPPLEVLANLLRNVGEAKRGLKDFPGTIQARRDELEVRRSILAGPTNLAARRNVSLALDRLGAASQAGKDFASAKAAYDEQLELDRAIAKDSANNPDMLWDVAWSLVRRGDLEGEAGNSTEAIRHYDEAVAIGRDLRTRQPDNPTRMRRFASSLGKLARMHSRTNDYAAALKLHQEEVGLLRKLLDLGASEPGAVRDLSLALDNLGNVFRDTGDLRAALMYYEEELAIDRSAVARAPENTTALSDLQWTLNKLSDFVLRRFNDRVAARTYIEEMIEIDSRLVRGQPTNRDRHRRLRDDLVKLASLLADLGDQGAARDAFGRSYEASDRWLGIARDNFMKTASDSNRVDLAQAYRDAGWYGILAGRYKEALPLVEAALSIDPNSPWNTVSLAHANLFLGRYAEALKLYESVQNLNRGNDGKATYGDRIRDDFAFFRRLGFPSSDIARAEKDLGI